MALLSRISCLAAFALFCGTARSVADELPVGSWKVRLDGNSQSDLLIAEVKPDGKVVGEVFGKPIDGKWDGTKLTFLVSHGDDLKSSFEGWLLQEKQGGKVRYTLMGVRKTSVYRCYFGFELPSREWYAHLKPQNKSRERGSRSGTECGSAYHLAFCNTTR